MLIGHIYIAEFVFCVCVAGGTVFFFFCKTIFKNKYV